VIELHSRRGRGETPTSQEYATSFAEYAAVVNAVFAMDGLVAPATTAPAGAGGPDVPDVPSIPGYRIGPRLGAGGMGVVYRAEQLSLNRAVALKLLRRAGGVAEEARFRREAEAAAQIAHEGVVRVHDLGVWQGVPYLCLELIEGGSLDRHLSKGPPPPRRAAELVERLARAAHAAHSKGVIHRDLKPANVLMAFADVEAGEAPWWERRYVPKIADFGLAKWAGDSDFTLTGVVMGTPPYMAPEQAEGKAKRADARTDVYALGAILYEALVGKPPFSGEKRKVLDQVLRDPPMPPRRRRREVPADLEAVCLKCLEKPPARRYASAEELADDLARFLRGEPTRARPRRWHQKAAAWVLGRPVLAGLACLAALTCLALPYVTRRLDPERPRKDVEDRLARGQTYELVGAGGLPGPFRWILGEGAAPRADVEEGCITVETFELGLLEVVADPKCDRYRLLVEMRHDEGPGFSSVGLYFAHREVRGQGARQGRFFALHFADRGTAARQEHDGAKQPLSRVKLECFCFAESPGTVPLSPRAMVGSQPFSPALPVTGPGPWRTLAVEVRPEGVKALWSPEGGALEEVTSATAQELEDYVAMRKRNQPRLADVPTGFLTRSGLGLYVRGGRLSFRRVKLEPLPAGA
jgi:serine/threonine-protein kinase